MSRRTCVATLAVGLSLGAPAAAGDPPATDITVVGVRGGVTRVRGGDRSGEVSALGISVTHVGFGLEGLFSVRAVNTGSLAAGANGIEGGLGQAVAGGLRAPFGKNHGLVTRLGLEFGFFGNKYLWDSAIELPQLQLGYQWLVPRSVIDVAMKGGYVIVGRHNTGDAGSRDLDGSLELGAIGALHVGAVDLRASSLGARRDDEQTVRVGRRERSRLLAARGRRRTPRGRRRHHVDHPRRTPVGFGGR